MRTFVFGCKGQLGRDVMRVFGEAGEVCGVDLPEVDIAEAGAAAAVLAEWQPDLVINAAAYTNVEGAEDDEEGATRGNDLGARRVAEAAQDAGAPVVLYSTDFVFDGAKQTPYVPEDETDPLSAYGRTKLAGEMATREANARHFILRTAWLYGPGGNNFVEKIIGAARKRSSLQIVEDEVGSPTHTWDLAEATRALAGTTLYGTYHAVNAGACSRYEFARAFLEMAGVEVEVTPCTADTFPSKAARPKYSVLDTSKLTEACGYRMRPWREALEHYMQRREESA